MPTDDTTLETITKPIDDATLEVSVALDNASDDYDSSSTSSSGSSSSSISDNEVDTVPDFPKILEAIASLMWRNFSQLNTDRRIGYTYWLMPNIRGSFVAEHCPKTYERLDRFPSHPLPTCVQCFASKIVGSFDEC